MRRMQASLGVLLLSSTLWPVSLEAQIRERNASGSTLRQAFVDFLGFFSIDPNEVPDAVAAEIVAFPIGSSSGAFSYTFEPSLGVAIVSSRSFGPWLAERSATMGRRGELNLGVSYQRVSYDSYDGLRFEKGDLSETYPRFELRPQFSFDRKFSVRSETAAFFSTFAVLSNLDVGIIVPTNRVTIRGTKGTRFSDVGLQSVLVGRRIVEQETVNIDRSSTGIGDVTVRAKWRFAQTRRSDYATHLEIRLPTGDADDMLGVGQTLVKVSFVASPAPGRLSPHINVGYTLDGGGEKVIVREVAGTLSYIVGFDIAAHPSVTLSAELLGRRLLFAPTVVRDQGQLQFDTGTRYPLLAAVGGKVKVFGQGLLGVHLLLPLNDAGLRPKPTAVIGFDYTF